MQGIVPPSAESVNAWKWAENSFSKQKGHEHFNEALTVIFGEVEANGSDMFGSVGLSGKGWHRAIIEGISGVQKQGQGSEL